MNLLSLALRDLRGSFRHLTIFIVCLWLGVTMISCVGLVTEAINAGLAANARKLLGGDIEIHQSHLPLPETMRKWLLTQGKLSESLELRTMAAHDNHFQLVELKAVDSHYPLYGTLELAPRYTADVFSKYIDGLYGIAVDRSLLSILDAKLGEVITLGDNKFQIRAIIQQEPDKIFNRFSLGPRILCSIEGLRASGLILPGSLISFRYNLKLSPSVGIDVFSHRIKQEFQNPTWQYRDYRNAAEGVKRILDRVDIFLALAGLTSLLTGGLGISHATLYYLQRKRRTIAILKCIGATEAKVIGIYISQLFAIASGTVLFSLASAVTIEWVLLKLLAPLLPVMAIFGIYLKPLAIAALLGILIMSLFAWPSLYNAAKTRPASLLRNNEITSARLPTNLLSLFILTSLLVLIYLTACVMTGNIPLTTAFFVGSTAAFLLFAGIGETLKWILGRINRKLESLKWRLAISNLTRPGASTTGMVMAIGFSFSLIIGLLQVSRNLEEQLTGDIAEQAPAFFMVDIQPNQISTLQSLLQHIPDAGKLDLTPMIRGRVTQINGIDVEKANIDPSVKWTISNERGVTYAATPPSNARIIAGRWWDENDSGQPQLSLDAEVAKGYGIGLGDTVTLNVLGQEVVGTITSLREINWLSMQMNFVFIFSPSSFRNLPQMYLATLEASPKSEAYLLRQIAQNFPNISIIQIRDTLKQANSLIRNIATLIISTAFITLLCSVFVMLGAVLANSRQRIYDNIILRVLGASKLTLQRIYGLEFLLLGTVTALTALLLGNAIAWGILELMEFFALNIKMDILGYIAPMIIFTALAGLAISQNTLKARPLDILRNE